jgi:hypothetical protein
MAYESLNQMYDNILDPIRGWWDERQLSKVVKISSSSTVSAVKAGMIGHLDSSGEFRTGITAATNQLPLFSRNNSDDGDVRGVEGNVSGVSGSPTAAAPDQGISTLVGAAAYELASTAYTDGTDGSFAIGAPVAAHATNGKIVPEGQATPTSGYPDIVGTDMHIGFCTATPANNYRGTSVVTFITSIFHV